MNTSSMSNLEGFRILRNNAWSSSDEMGEAEDQEGRDALIYDYNKLAERCGIAIIVPDKYEPIRIERIIIEGQPGGWLIRKVLRRPASLQFRHQPTTKALRHRRSDNDTRPIWRETRHALDGKTVDELIRVCGSSTFWLPAALAPASLSIPTCLRSIAQHLVQYATANPRVFCVSGSTKTIDALYSHYSIDNRNPMSNVKGIERSSQLPEHIPCTIHDVAGAFKKFLSGLPNGILGSIWLFDALVAIFSFFAKSPEKLETKSIDTHARMIALAIGCVPSKHERELICAVVGLFGMIGTETVEVMEGSQRLRSQRAYYRVLGNMLGPLLLGKSLDDTTVHAGPYLDVDHFQTAGTLQTPTSLAYQKSWRTRPRKLEGPLTENYFQIIQGEKYKLANNVAEMLIKNWKNVVRQMIRYGTIKPTKDYHMTRLLRRLSDIQRVQSRLHSPDSLDIPIKKRNHRQVFKRRSPRSYDPKVQPPQAVNESQDARPPSPKARPTISSAPHGSVIMTAIETRNIGPPSPKSKLTIPFQPPEPVVMALNPLIAALAEKPPALPTLPEIPRRPPRSSKIFSASPESTRSVRALTARFNSVSSTSTPVPIGLRPLADWQGILSCSRTPQQGFDRTSSPMYVNGASNPDNSGKIDSNNRNFEAPAQVPPPPVEDSSTSIVDNTPAGVAKGNTRVSFVAQGRIDFGHGASAAQGQIDYGHKASLAKDRTDSSCRASATVAMLIHGLTSLELKKSGVCDFIMTYGYPTGMVELLDRCREMETHDKKAKQQDEPLHGIEVSNAMAKADRDFYERRSDEFSKQLDRCSQDRDELRQRLQRCQKDRNELKKQLRIVKKDRDEWMRNAEHNANILHGRGYPEAPDAPSSYVFSGSEETL